jgi:hypothetical protein
VNPVDNSYVYAQYQYGSLFRSTNGGASFSYAASALSGRVNWSMPVVFDPSDPAVLYAGTDRVYRSPNHGAGWSAISADLTDGAGAGNRVYGTITTLAVAATDPDVIWAGTDDANVWVSTNGGSGWTQVGLSLPQRWITRVAVDPSSADVSYVTVSGFRWDEPYPHVFRSTDYGASFQDISSNLPQAPVNDIVPSPNDPSVLFVATDTGVYFTANLGLSWSALGTGLPNVVVSDLRLHEDTQMLYAGTYGRSMWRIPVATVAPVAAGPAAGPGASALQLGAPFPNPSRDGGATVRYVLPRRSEVRLDVFDVGGRRVRTLVSATADAGGHAARWDGRDERGAPVAAGVYLIRARAGGEVRDRKITVVR